MDGISNIGSQIGSNVLDFPNAYVFTALHYHLVGGGRQRDARSGRGPSRRAQDLGRGEVLHLLALHARRTCSDGRTGVFRRIGDLFHPRRAALIDLEENKYGNELSGRGLLYKSGALGSGCPPCTLEFIFSVLFCLGFYLKLLLCFVCVVANSS